MATNSYTQAVGGDATHQKVALSYLKQGISPITAMEQLKASNYVVNIAGVRYKIKASSIASIITGFQLMVHQVVQGKATITKAKGLSWKM